jgi:fibronectin type 3 domain-containing protein
VILNGATGTLYVDGVQVGQNTAMTLTPSSLGATTNNYIGKSQFNDPYLNGAVDDFKIFGVALNAQQIASLAVPPTAPTSLVASSGDLSATLSWGAVTGAVSYNVKRAAVSGGPYTLVANTTDTEFINTGLTNGTIYYYVVTALNTATESLASTEVNVVPLSESQQWRLANFGTTANSGNAADTADPDGDGLTNAQEFSAGTNPNNASSALGVSQVQASGNDLLVSFATVLGKVYRVDRSDTLQPNSWTTLQTNISGTGGTVQITDAGAAAQTKRFYRIVLLP